MADLPAVRVTSGKFFNKVGVDFVDPLLVKRGWSEIKRHWCICLKIRVIHFVLAEDLSRDAFIHYMRQILTPPVTEQLKELIASKNQFWSNMAIAVDCLLSWSAWWWYSISAAWHGYLSLHVYFSYLLLFHPLRKMLVAFSNAGPKIVHRNRK